MKHLRQTQHHTLQDRDWETGGAGGTTFFARVRAVNSILTAGSYSVVLNTSTGEVVAGDIADGAIDTEQLADGAVTGEKTTGLVADLTLPGPPFVAGDANKYLRVNSAFSSYTLAGGTLPNLAAAGNVNDYLRVTAADTVDYDSGTLPPVSVGGDAGKTIRVVGADNLAYTSWTIPSSVTNNALFIGSSGNLAQTSYTFPTAATADNVIVGDGSNFGLQNQNPTDSAATSTSHSNRSGSVTLAGGLTLHWDTIDTTSGVDSTVGGFTAVRSVMACWGESAGTAAPVKAYISTASTTITIRQDSGANMEVTYWALEEL